MRELELTEIEDVSGGVRTAIVEAAKFVGAAVTSGVIYDAAKSVAGAVYNGVQGSADSSFTGPRQDGCHNQCNY